MSEIDKEADLSRRLDVISNLPIRLDDKIFMSLVCLDMIPVWEVSVSEGEIEIDDLGARLVEAGFEIKTIGVGEGEESGFGKKRQIVYSNSLESVNRLFELHGYSFGMNSEQDGLIASEFGKLYGFPSTAVDAYVNDRQNTFSKRDLPTEFQNEDYVFLAQFSLSKDHWQEELEVPKKWAKALKQYVPDLWRAYVSESCRFRSENYGDR